ncbi:50S ribosomal protein L4 [Salinibacter ruber]|jgi:large subunit ribosomal protein L4|uniref:Large ribosomal subunit protein uL4 n=2 Tax=Salinibacter ruber TaxID=146919 RepID=RL4_SALRD|nr:50S ribosomal protein L4 [Salinibacter ruber]Q2S3R3.1 RecName: Full=Large ribosomal subunit protein uL4; AltName: Full=50S ribosomal protein L4 [Salinibacter ruber DSM 13855]ABC44078.1 ribosomal protein L4/L1 family [Salinibacter ruber DSM 13855]MBB4060876.1 large subunit ribosomal protein L4 [Salinibacter ruber]MBB4070471.1 large subunit ribosomal protein L4 [Salinibacter ruber]MBB4091233.1 large subunit ribosomal protein L4 [Salinibacter ruber]MCS3612253.1 large subunit ribosomal protein
MDVEIYQEDGVESGETAALDPTVFDIEPNDHIIWLDVKRIQAHQRQGTSKTKERGEVRGSGRKLYRQKGTGNARVGDAQSPIRRGGGRAHGARPRDYAHDLNQKEKRLARRSALSYKAANDNIQVIENFSLDRPDTRGLTDLFELLGVEGQDILLATAEVEREVYLSSQNLPDVNVQEVQSINTVDILDADVVLLQEGALDWLTDVLSTDEAVPA